MVSPLIGLSSVTLVLFAVRNWEWSRLFLFLFAVQGAVYLCAYRLTLRWYRRKRVASGFYTKNVVLIGSTPALEWLASHVAKTAAAEYELTGYLSLSSDQPVPMPALTKDGTRRLQYHGGVDDLAALLVHRPVHEIVAVPGSNADWLKSVIETCDYFRVTLRIVPEALLVGTLRDLQFIYRSNPLQLPEVVLTPPDFDSDALFIKRMIDILVSAALLVLLLPLFGLIALAIKLTTPELPVFYRWNVVGYKGKRFSGYKFSTMVADADARKGELMQLNEMTGPVFKIKNDPRVTRLGRFLRKYSLNELPQLWSVLKGDMSLVGPRPAGPHELPGYKVWQKRKLSVRPGITCLWQVRGRNEISNFDDWVRMDFEYIDNWSLWLDCRILIKTFCAVVRGTGS